MPDDDLPEPYTKVTLNSIYALVLDVKSDVRDLKNADNAAQNMLEDHDKRIRALELRFYGILAGLLTAIGVIAWRVH